MLFRNALCFDLAHISHSCSEYLSLLQSYCDRRFIKKKIRKQITFVNVKCDIVVHTYQWYEQRKGKQKPTQCIYRIGKSTSLLMVSHFIFCSNLTIFISRFITISYKKRVEIFCVAQWFTIYTSTYACLNGCSAKRWLSYSFIIDN